MTVLELYNDLSQKLNNKSKKNLKWLFKEYVTVLPYEWRTKKVSSKLETKLRAGAERLNAGEPLQYIIGNVIFCDNIISVDKRVLIPRFETELLCDIITQDYIDTNFTKILDLCTGSGCIAISLAKNIPNAIVYASDISSDALTVAKKNAKNNQANITFVKSNLLENIDDTFDLIVSNPPYLNKKDMRTISKTIKNHEPHTALFGGDDGLDFYRQIALTAPSRLNDKGVVYLEVGDEQARDVIKILEPYFCDFEIINDYNDFERFVKAVKR